MLSDSELIVHRFVEKQPLLIYPISDVHLGAAEHMTREWELFCMHLLDQPNAYITLGGDLINNATRSSVSNIFEETMRPREQKKIITEMLTPIKSRILGCVSGNHERRSVKDVDDDPTYDIMCKLDLEHIFRENLAFIKIQFGEKRASGDRNPTYILTLTHGSGGGALTGGVVNKAERFAYTIDNCDCLIIGHSHKPFITAPGKIHIDPRKNRASIRPFRVVSSSSWLQYGGYAAHKLLMPSSHAPEIILLHPDTKKMDITMKG